jgi:oligopeptide/dipeptide ABC transporter ATP-binding protein
MKDSMSPIIKLDRVKKAYSLKTSFLGKKEKKIIALDRVSLFINQGEILGLVGESGSGKTTAGRLIVKLENPDSGKIYLHGNETSTLKGKQLVDFRLKVQMIFQDPYQSLNPQLSIFDSTVEPLIINKLGNLQSRYETVSQALAFVGLNPPETFLNRYPHQLSGGQRQRVAIARAMILNPEFMVADEPTSMLDAPIKLQIFNILLSLKQKRNVSMLFITHSIAAARYLCDRIAVIYKGCIMEIGPAINVMTHPKHPYTKALIDAYPDFVNFKEQKYKTLLKIQRPEVSGEHCPFFTRCRIAKIDHCDKKKPALEKKNENHLVACFFS